MRYFDFLFYLIYRLYSTFGEKGAESTASAIVGGFPVLNIMMTIMLFQLSFPEKLFLDKLLIVVLFLVFQLLAFYRYNILTNYSANEMGKRWLGQTKPSQIRIQTILAIYGVLSVAGTFALAIYLGRTI